MSSIIDKKTIFLDVYFENKTSVLQNIARVAQDEDISTSEMEVLESLESREDELSTSVGFEIAIPHCKSDCIKQSKVMIYRLSEYVDWGEGEKVNLVFAILTSDKNSEHLSILSKLSRGLLRKEFLENLKYAGNKDEVYDLLEGLLM